MSGAVLTSVETPGHRKPFKLTITETRCYVKSRPLSALGHISSAQEPQEAGGSLAGQGRSRAFPLSQSVLLFSAQEPAQHFIKNKTTLRRRWSS